MTAHGGGQSTPKVRAALPLGSIRILAKHARGEHVAPSTLAYAIEEVEAHVAWHDAMRWPHTAPDAASSTEEATGDR